MRKRLCDQHVRIGNNKTLPLNRYITLSFRLRLGLFVAVFAAYSCSTTFQKFLVRKEEAHRNNCTDEGSPKEQAFRLDVLQIEMDDEEAPLPQEPELARERPGVFQQQQTCTFQQLPSPFQLPDPSDQPGTSQQPGPFQEHGPS